MPMTGTDTSGIPRKLGDIDSDGEIVGYIDENGNCYIDETERWVAQVSGRHLDAWEDWRRAGRPGPPPSPLPFLQVAPERLHEEVLEAVCWQIEQYEWLMAVGRKAKARPPEVPKGRAF